MISHTSTIGELLDAFGMKPPEHNFAGDPVRNRCSVLSVSTARELAAGEKRHSWVIVSALFMKNAVAVRDRTWSGLHSKRI
jgi:hypothetical protein